MAASPCPRIALHGSSLASISLNHAAGLANVRAAFAAAHAAIRSLSFELERAIVVGISVGLWVPGAGPQLTSALPQREASARFMTALFAATRNDSGHIIKYTMDVVPP